MYQITDELKNRVNQMFGKTEQSVQEDVQHVKEWLQTQPHLPEIMDEKKIRNFLTMCKFNVKKVKEKIDNYYTVRSKFPALFENCNPKLPNMKKAREQIIMATHPELMDGIYRVTFVHPKPGEMSPRENFLLFTELLEIRLQADIIAQDVIVVDMCNVTFKEMVKLSFPLMIKICRVYMAVYALRLKKVYFLNSPSYINMFIKILQYLVPQKIFDRFEVHNDAEVLKDNFSADILPKDYGGNGPSLDELDEMMSEVFEKFQDRFDLLDTLRVDESLRPKS